ncbi:MAG TPA: metal-dependent hydrolase [Cellvibrionales bacterium]|nr:metal-dependent hydrolase [Cellvibrionales bacterium]
MDPVTQGVLGASLSQSFSRNKKQTAIAGLFGLLSGLAPDLDVFIRSSSDPLLFLEYHRHFTHSLAFIPFGGLLCGTVMYLLLGKRWGVSFLLTCLYCTLGYATHAVLDACTSYGTQLFWPFSNIRIAWNSMSIIDPIYTVPIIVGVLLAAIKKQPSIARIVFAWALIYPCIGVFQHNRAIEAGLTLAHARGHEPIRINAKPSLGNIFLWKVIYETHKYYYVDAVRVLSDTKKYPGEKIEKLDIARDFYWLDRESQQAKDIERFRWFSNGYIAQDPNNPNRIVDVRYSFVPNEVEALWGILLSPQADVDEHVVYSGENVLTTRHQDAFFGQLRGE